MDNDSCGPVWKHCLFREFPMSPVSRSLNPHILMVTLYLKGSGCNASEVDSDSERFISSSALYYLSLGSWGLLIWLVR